jgi:hypothetical protein
VSLTVRAVDEESPDVVPSADEVVDAVVSSVSASAPSVALSVVTDVASAVDDDEMLVASPSATALCPAQPARPSPAARTRAAAPRTRRTDRVGVGVCLVVIMPRR